MLTKYARPFIRLGERIAEARMVYEMAAAHEPGDPERQLDTDEKKHVAKCSNTILELCLELDLEISKDLFSKAVDDLPETTREYNYLIDTLHAEIKNKLFVFVLPHRRRFFQPRNFMVESTKTSFPKARKEMAEAGRCHAVGLYTAAVFHCMRAIELGLRAMAVSLNCSFPIPLEQVNQENLISNIESKIRDIKDRPKGAEKDADQKFYSQAAMQFRYFKDGWRVRVAHTRETYDEANAQSVIEHAATFFEILSTRLKEPVA